MRYTPALMVLVAMGSSGPGFSRKRRRRPSASVSTNPYCRGSATERSRIVVREPCASWNARMAERSASVSTSPFSTQTAPRVRSAALRMPPPVPSGSDSIT